MSEIDSFCKNCEYPKSKHKAEIFDYGRVDWYSCPSDDTGRNFWRSVGFVPMTNLEYLERKYQEKING